MRIDLQELHTNVLPIEDSLIQDRINSAVSEREDRVIDVTTLTRMTGSILTYWAATGLY